MSPLQGPDSWYRLVCHLAATPRIERLDNGLTIAVFEDHRTELVSTALCYRAGTRLDPAHRIGVAHFLEHMMFRGSARYPPGEIDRRTLASGGSNNAYTTHDSTVYHFTFASDRWPEALEMEADRMAGLLLAPKEIERERAVILEEVSMSEDDPWEALEIEVHAALFGAHPYGRPILGTRATLGGIGRSELAEFHCRHYRPENAVLVAGGDVGADALDLMAEQFDKLRRDKPVTKRTPRPRRRVDQQDRIVRQQGDLARLLLAYPSPPAVSSDFGSLRLLLTILGGGRASRLHRRLVEEEELCLSVSTEITETVESGLAAIAVEVVTGAEPRQVEERVLEEVQRAIEDSLTDEEIERARRLLLADWVFGFEKIHQRVLNTVISLAIFEPDYLQQHLRQILESDAARLRDVGSAYLAPDSAVVGWSLPES